MVALFAALAMLITPVATSTLLVGTVGCVAVQPGNSVVVVRAEQAATLSLAVIDGFLRYEQLNRATLLKLNPGIKLAADALRTEAPKAVTSLRNATKAYKSNRSPENEANLNTWLAVVETLMADSNRWFAAAKTN